MDEGFFGKQRNDDGDQRCKVLMEESDQWSSIKVSTGSGHVCNLHNDMMEGVNSYMSFFADDAKLLRKIESGEDYEALRQNLDRLSEWSHRWEIEFNTRKCSVMEIGKSKKRTSGNYTMGNESIRKTSMEKDLGVTVSGNLSPEKHRNRIVSET